MRRLGFTLVELLIALAILALIAVFAIPKVIANQENARKHAVIKETIAALNQVTYMATVKRDGLNPGNNYNYYFSHLNAIRGDVACGNLWTQPDGSPDTNACQAILLSNGAMMTGFNSCCNFPDGSEGDTVTIDWNGTAGPNVFGDDQFDVFMNWGTKDYGWAPYYKVGTVSPDANTASNATLFNQVFK